MKNHLFIYGYSDYARLCRHFFSRNSSYKFEAYLVDDPFVTKLSAAPDPIKSINDPNISPRLDRSTLLVAIGYKRMRNRRKCFQKGKRTNAKMANFVSSDASVDPSVRMGYNNVVMPGSVIEPFVELGDNNIIWSNSTICHETTIGDHNFIAAGAILGGRSLIGDLCFFGFSSVVLQGVTVADETLLGASSTLNEDSRIGEKRIGQPSRKVGSHIKHGICI